MPTPYLKKHDNGTWYVHWTQANGVGKRVSAGTKEVAEAQRFLGHWLLMENKSVEARGAELTLADIWSVYVKKHVRVKADPYAADLAWKQLQPHFGHLPAAGLTQDTVDTYTELRTSGRLGRKVKPPTVTREVAWLRAAVRFCASDKQRLIDKGFVREISLPEPGDPRDRWLRHDEIQRLLDAAAARRGPDGRLTRVERFLWLALETAAREQALLDLTWDRVDFEIGMISLDVPGRRKTKKRRADVPISKALRPVLERAFREKTGDRVLDNGASVWAAIQSVAIDAGFSSQARPKTGQKPKATGVSPHVLRHTAATHMARRGVSLWKIAKILGNTILVVEKTYAKFCPEDLREAVDLISGDTLETTE